MRKTLILASISFVLCSGRSYRHDHQIGLEIRGQDGDQGSELIKSNYESKATGRIDPSWLRETRPETKVNLEKPVWTKTKLNGNDDNLGMGSGKDTDDLQQDTDSGNYGANTNDEKRVYQFNAQEVKKIRIIHQEWNAKYGSWNKDSKLSNTPWQNFNARGQINVNGAPSYSATGTEDPDRTDS